MTLSKLKWLYPGMGVKRWLLFMMLGVVCFGVGVIFALNIHLQDAIKFSFVKFIYLSTDKIFTLKTIGIFLTLGGLITILFSLRGLNKSLWGAMSKLGEDSLVEMVYRERQGKRGPNIVAIGGGTGLSTLLRGIKKYTSNITAAVTVTDDGGSSGWLRTELGVMPPGDIRNCLIALAEAEPLIYNLFQYRFKEGSLSGQNFGNIFISALEEVTGDFTTAVKKSHEVLKVRGKVLPSTKENVTLGAELMDGTKIWGESNISLSSIPIKKIYLQPEICRPSPEILQAIDEADLIIIGPGSLYTSILPNLLLSGLPSHLTKSKALKIFICNVMTQPGETSGFKASDHLKIIYNHIGNIKFDYVLINNKIPSETLLKKYRETNADFVLPDFEEIKKMQVKIIYGDFLNETDLVRHNSTKLAKKIMELL